MENTGKPEQEFVNLENVEEEIEPFDEIYNAIASDKTLDQDQKDRLMNLVSDFLFVDEGFESPETDSFDPSEPPLPFRDVNRDE